MEDEVGAGMIGVAGFDVSAEIWHCFNERLAAVGVYGRDLDAEMPVDGERIAGSDLAVSLPSADLESLGAGADGVGILFADKE